MLLLAGACGVIPFQPPPSGPIILRITAPLITHSPQASHSSLRAVRAHSSLDEPESWDRNDIVNYKGGWKRYAGHVICTKLGSAHGPSQTPASGCSRRTQIRHAEMHPPA